MEVVELAKILTSYQHWFEVDLETPNAAYRVMETLLHSGLIRDFLSINRYQDALWFNKESFEKLCRWLRILLMYDVVQSDTTAAAVRQLEARNEILETFERAESESGFRVTALLDALKTEESPVA